jgi:CHASE1-domain containing sensor protein
MLLIDKFLRFMSQVGKRSLLIVSLLLTLTLSGCVQYETTIRFQRFNAGELVQHVRIETQLYQLDKPAIDRWISSIEQRTKALGGQLQHPSQLDLTATLPFHTAQELTEKFAAFFSSEKDGGSITPQMELQENNFLLASRYRLNYDVDLSSLTNNLSPASNKSSDLAFTLALQVPSRPWSLSQKWQLPIGHPHHTQATFWLLNPLGIGGVFIIGLVIVAYRLHSRLTATRS